MHDPDILLASKPTLLYHYRSKVSSAKTRADRYPVPGSSDTLPAVVDKSFGIPELVSSRRERVSNQQVEPVRLRGEIPGRLRIIIRRRN